MATFHPYEVAKSAAELLRPKSMYNRAVSDPTIQAAWKRGKWLLGGVAFVIAVVTGIRNAHAITPSVTVIGVILAAVICVGAELLIRRYHPEWRLPGSDRRIRITSMSLQPRWFFAGVLVILLLPRLIEFFENSKFLQPQTDDMTVEEKRYPQ